MQGFTRYATVVYYANEIFEACDFLSRQIYSRIEFQNKSNNFRTLYKWTKINLKIFKLATILVIITGVTFSVFPIINYYLYGHLDLILEVHIPGLDKETVTGYLSLTFFHVFISVFGLIGTLAADMLVILLILHSLTMSEVFANNIHQLNDKLKKTKKQNTRYVHVFVRNIIQMHQEYCL